jgi:SOS response regulatory protein OraA/RecX
MRPYLEAMARLTIVRDSDDRKRTRNRAVALRLDDSAWLRVSETELAELGVSDGRSVTAEQQVEIETRLARARSRAFVVRSLAVRAQSIAEIERKLAERSIPPAIAEESIELARGYGYLDDEVLAGQLARGMRERGYGRRRAERSLRLRGIPAELAGAALDESYGRANEHQDALRALGRRTVGDSDGERRRAAAYLVRRGFSSGAAWAAVRVAGAEQSSPSSHP